MRIIIAGASSGIGLCSAQLLIEKGHQVVNISRTKPSGFASIFADAAVPGSMKSAVKEAAEGGAIDALIYSSGCSLSAPAEHLSPEKLRYLFEVNFFGATEAILAAIPFMKKQGSGKIIVISSMAAQFPIPFDAPYCASKAALESFVAAADIELNPFGISLCAVRPGGVKTGFTFERMVDGYSCEYEARRIQAAEALANEEQHGDDPQKVARLICNILARPHPKPLNVCGAKNNLRHIAGCIAPKKLSRLLVAKKYHQNKGKNIPIYNNETRF